MAIRLNAEDEPAKTRVDYWQHVVGSSVAPYHLRASADTLRSQIRQAQIGAVSVADVQMSALQAVRTPDLIRESDRGMCLINLGLRGRGRYEQDGRQSVLAPGEFHLVDLSRPSQVAVDASQETLLLMFPRALLPARDKDLRELTAVGFSARDPYASLVAALGQELARHLDAYESARSARVGAAFLDLLALAVAERVDRVAAVPAESRQQAMLAQVQAFIGERLGDPGLSPGMIAAACHVSVRTLHSLYQADNDTVAASVRRRRLERCRRDLLDPGLRDRPVGAVGARWGFPDAAGFSRAFRAAYGLPPGEYRALHAAGGAPGPTGP
jgi:AraC-like DNA-binding protein